MNHDLIYTKHDNEIIDYSNLNYVDDVSTHCFITKYVFYLVKELITVRSILIKMIALLMTEIEYMMLCFTAQETLWLKNFFNHLNHIINSITVYENNCSAIDLTKNPEIHSQSKHIDMCFHWLCQAADKNIHVKWIESSKQTADEFTKPLLVIVYECFIVMLNISDK